MGNGYTQSLLKNSISFIKSCNRTIGPLVLSIVTCISSFLSVSRSVYFYYIFFALLCCLYCKLFKMSGKLRIQVTSAFKMHGYTLRRCMFCHVIKNDTVGMIDTELKEILNWWRREMFHLKLTCCSRSEGRTSRHRNRSRPPGIPVLKTQNSPPPAKEKIPENSR